MPASTSYQLPDLLALINNFELHANQSCRNVTEASEKWFLTNAEFDSVFNESERTTLHGTKPGLLAALCCPTCDAPQLRLVTDFLTLLIVSNSRATPVSTRDGSDKWILVGEESVDGIGGDLALTSHRLFRHIAPRILRLAQYSAHPSWMVRFDRSLAAYRAAQSQLGHDHARQCIPHLDAYKDLRRDSSGLRMLFDLIELAEGLNLPDEVVNASLLKQLTHCSMDIISWSMDIVSYHLEQPRGNNHNLVAVLIAENGYSIQSAINAGSRLVKQSIDAFIATERLLLSSFSNARRQLQSSAWPSTKFRSSPTSALGTETERDVRLYVRGLRDCVAGFINWMYETELFFGEKGSEVRSFGWVFLTFGVDKPRGV